MKVTWLQRFTGKIRLLFARLKFKIMHPTQKVSITPKGKNLMEYCFKVIESGGAHEPSGYSEYMSEEFLRKIAEECDMTIGDAALMILYTAYISGALTEK